MNSNTEPAPAPVVTRERLEHLLLSERTRRSQQEPSLKNIEFNLQEAIRSELITPVPDRPWYYERPTEEALTQIQANWSGWQYTSAARRLTPADVERYLQKYRAHRATRPLPEGWSEDLSGLTRPVPWYHAQRPVLVFRNGARSVEIDVSSQGVMDVFFYDTEGYGFSVPEMFGLITAFVGANPDPAEVVAEFADEGEDLFQPSCPGQPWRRDLSLDDDVFCDA